MGSLIMLFSCSSLLYNIHPRKVLLLGEADGSWLVCTYICVNTVTTTIEPF